MNTYEAVRACKGIDLKYNATIASIEQKEFVAETKAKKRYREQIKNAWRWASAQIKATTSNKRINAIYEELTKKQKEIKLKAKRNREHAYIRLDKRIERAERVRAGAKRNIRTRAVTYLKRLKNLKVKARKTA